MAKRETLNARQLAFVLAYTSGPTRGNATQSARAAGYTGTDETLSVTGARLLGNPKVSSELQRRAEVIQRPAIADAEETRKVMTADLRNPSLSAADRARVATVLAKMGGWFSFVHRHEGSGGGAIVHEVRMTLADAKVLAKEKP